MYTETDFTIKSEMESELLPGEKLLWAGGPKTGIVFRPFDILLIPISLFWIIGFSFVFYTVAFDASTPKAILLAFIPFFLFVAYFAVGRFWIDIRRRANTKYGITEKRVIISSGIFAKSIQSVNIKAITDISIKEKNDCSGTITFGPSDISAAMMSNIGFGFQKGAPKLEMIDNVRRVYNQLLQLQST